MQAVSRHSLANVSSVSPSDSSGWADSSRLFQFGILLLLLLPVAVWTLNAKYRAPVNDEAWIGNSAHTYAHEGVLRTTVLETRGTFMEGADKRSFWVFPVHPILEAGVLRVAGTTNGFYLRVLSVMAGMALLAVVALIVYRLTRSMTAASLAALLTACDYTVFASASLARPEILVAAFGYAALYLLLSDSRRQWVAGSLCLVAALLTHPYAVVLAVCAGVVVLRDGRGRWIERLAAIALAGILAAAVLLAWGNTDWDLFVRHIGGNARAGRTLQAPWTALARDFTTRITDAYGLTSLSSSLIKSAPLWALLGLGTMALSSSGSRHTASFRAVRTFLLALAAGWLGLAMIDSKKFAYYWTILSPMVAVLIALLWYTIARSFRPLWGKAALGALLLASLGVTAAAGSVALRKNGDTFKRVAAELSSQRSGGTVFAPAGVALELGYPDWITDDRRLGFLSGRTPSAIVLDQEYRSFTPLSPEEASHRAAVLSRFRTVLKSGELELLVSR